MGWALRVEMGRVRVAVLDDYNGAAEQSADWSRLSGIADVTFFKDHLTAPPQLADRLRDFEIVVIERERTPFRQDLLAALPALRLLIATGPVNWSIDFACAAERGITVCGTEAVQTYTPELTLGLILALARRIVAEDRVVRAGGWQSGVGSSVKGKVLGLIGLGRIGRMMTELVRPLGMNVIAWSQNLTAETASAVGVRRVDKNELLAAADYVSLHVVLSERTRGIIGAGELARMKRSAFLVNTSRGPLVDESALVAALCERRIAGAALDVFDIEPLPAAHPFRTLENVIITPHVGYITDDQCRLFYGQVIENIEAYVAGKPIRLLAAA
jgi:phosphoglycerate dehydrogenase-like enzyme